MTWKVFAGDESDTYAALIHLRTIADALSEDDEGPAKCLRAHIHRGLAYLASGKKTQSISDFLKRWVA